MKASRWDYFAPLSGAVSMLFLIAGSGLLGVYDYLPSAEQLVDFFSGNSTRVILVGYTGLFSAGLLLWFGGSIYSTLVSYEGEPGRLSMVAFGGCMASAIVVGAGFTVLITAGARAGAVEGLEPATAIALYDLYGTLLGQMAAYTFAVLIAATGALSLRTMLFPDWFGWASVLIAIGLVTPIGYFVMAFTLLWVLGVSIALFRRSSRPIPSERKM